MKFKAGVIPANLHPAILMAMDLADELWRKTFDLQPVVTSFGDGTHMASSRHYGLPGDTRVRAMDLRTRNLTEAQREEALLSLRELLGEAFDVVLGSDHLHIEFDPKI